VRTGRLAAFSDGVFAIAGASSSRDRLAGPVRYPLPGRAAVTA
jgi:hypothetical protein